MECERETKVYDMRYERRREREALLNIGVKLLVSFVVQARGELI